ncbi:MAG: hypothetical protein IAF38_14265, partial [Bacteroidia bacterium]|nr:hypothetical protein [Bacteroidia bacterium]
MNKELYDSFAKLNEAARSGVKHKLKDSPIGLRLFEFLEKGKNRAFRNREVVEFVYRSDLGKIDYGVLENRYFKLRKKFFEEYFTVPENTGEILTEEET